jgi:hypothetical protein
VRSRQHSRGQLTNRLVSGGEFEGAGSRNLILTFHVLSGKQVGACGLVLLENCMFVPLRNNSIIEVLSVSVLTFSAARSSTRATLTCLRSTEWRM